MATEVETTFRFKRRLIIANGINLVAAINNTIIDNAKKGMPAQIQMPRLFDRAFLIHHEAGVLPMYDTLEEG